MAKYHKRVRAPLVARVSQLWGLVLLGLLAGCDQQTVLNKLAPEVPLRRSIAVDYSAFLWTYLTTPSRAFFHTQVGDGTSAATKSDIRVWFSMAVD